MQDWVKGTLILCAFGTLREIRPSEPFVSEFLLGPWRNITVEQLNRDIYPVGTYSYLSLLVVVFLITDFLRFKPVIILSGLSGISVYAILLWTESLEWLQVTQFLYGLYIATEVAYYTYIYAKVDSSKYPRVTSYTRIATLAGRSFSGILSQLLVYYQLMNLRDLNYITYTAQILATFWALWLPRVKFGIYFHRKNSPLNVIQVNITAAPDKQLQIQNEKRSLSTNVVEASTLIARHARMAFSRPKVLAWSALYAVALGLFVMAQTYIQLLWNEIQQNDGDYTLWNGAVEATQTLLGAGAAYLASKVTHAAVVVPAALVQALALFLGTYIPNVYVSYAGYIVMGVLYYFTITLASVKIAGQLSDESCFGLIFGINTLLGTGLQTILTVVVIQTLMMSIHAQYYILSVLFLVLGCVWFIGWLIYKFKQNLSVSVINLN